MKKTLLLLLLTCSCAIAAAQERSPLRQTEFISADSLEDEHELLERVRNMPNLEVGKGITFRPKSNWFSLTMRFRMQNMVGLSFDKDFTLTKTDAQVKRLRLRFDGYIYSPKLVYSVQLGFTSYDTETAAQRQYEHRPRRNRLLRPESQVEHRVRADQDQGQPGAHQLFERPAIRRPQHRQQRVQPRPRFRVLRRIQHARGRGLQPLGQRFGDAGRRPQLGQFVQRRARLHGTAGALPAGAVQVERRRDGGGFRRRGAGQDTRGRSLLLQPQGIAPERPARRRHAGRRDPQHRLLFRGFHPQIPGLRILYRFHGTQLRPTAVRPPEQCLRIQRAGAQHTDQLPVRQEMGGRPA